MFQKGDLVEIEYPIPRYNDDLIVIGTCPEPRLGIVLGGPFDRQPDTEGKILKKCLYRVYDSQQMLIYERIFSGYLTPFEK